MEQSLSGLHSPLCAVGVAGMTFIVGLCILEDEAVSTLKAIGTLLHTVGTVLEMETFLTMLWSLWGGGGGGGGEGEVSADAQPFKASRSGGKTIITVEKNLRQLWNDSTWVTTLQEMTNKVRRNKWGLVFIYLFMCLKSRSVYFQDLLPNFLQVDRIYSCAWWQVRHEGHICGAAIFERWSICWSPLYTQTDWKGYFDRNNS